MGLRKQLPENQVQPWVPCHLGIDNLLRQRMVLGGRSPQQRPYELLRWTTR